ncbi:MAG: SixA phosphatase family protein [Bacteroidota bacterium]|nr:histidine phosphatase family protein [Cytophagales bacterium]MCE2955981.1 histidine phosphatase family protein [Flammeovirgaceae bacterium]MCZ8070243.1 histidine phosphatase family protein [Cytophagales bacterium]
MKKLYIIRHAKSSWEDPDLSDFDRPLNDRGKRDAPRMARRLKEKRLTPDIVLTSPARRAKDTCHIFCKGLGFIKSKIEEKPGLYHASDDEILKVIHTLKDRTGDDEENVLIFGHNPGLTEFANRLSNENIDNIPTAGVVCISLSANKWKHIEWGSGKLVFFDFPKKRVD